VGSRFLTKKEAAKVLGCSERTIFYKVQRGELRTVKNGHRVDILEEDVIALRDSQRKSDGEKALPFAINRQTLMRLHTENSILRRDVDQILRVLNIRKDPLRFTDLEITSLYQMANTYASDGWPPHVEETWAGYLQRIDAQHFGQIERMTKDSHPWRPFLRLASTMALRPYNTELSIQLSSAREHMQMMTSVWFEIKQISPRQLDAMLNREARPSKRLLNKLERRQKEYAAKN